VGLPERQGELVAEHVVKPQHRHEGMLDLLPLDEILPSEVGAEEFDEWWTLGEGIETFKPKSS
jgi:hypothetical protein